MKPVAVALVAALALVACKKQSPPARRLNPPTGAEAEAIAKEFATKFAPCNEAEIDRLVDLDLLIARAVAGHSKFDLAAFKRGFGGSLGKMLCKEVGAVAVEMTYLRTNQTDGPKPLLRLLGDAGVNYYELDLDKHDGVVRIADIYIYMSGEKLSESMSRLVAMAMRTEKEDVQVLKTMRQHMNNGEWEQANAVSKTLPATVRATKPIKLMEVQIAGELGDDVYLAALNDFAKAYPNDPSLALVSIDRAVLRKDYDAVFARLDELDKRVADPYLDVMRSGAFAAAGKLDEALAAAKRATEREPTQQLAWWELLTNQAAAKRYTEATATLDTLRDKFSADVSTDTLAGDDRFVELVESAEYEAWLAKSPAAAR